MENMRLWDKKQKGWIGEPFWAGTNGTYIIKSNGKFQEVSADQYILQKSTGKTDRNLKEIFEGDIVKSQVGGQKIEIKYGKYKAFCPADQEYMDNIGFYATCKGYMDMPIGPLEEYAVWIGNIFEQGDKKKIKKFFFKFCGLLTDLFAIICFEFMQYIMVLAFSNQIGTKNWDFYKSIVIILNLLMICCMRIFFRKHMLSNKLKERSK